jgi:hypothetical protein
VKQVLAALSGGCGVVAVEDDLSAQQNHLESLIAGSA